MNYTLKNLIHTSHLANFPFFGLVTAVMGCRLLCHFCLNPLGGKRATARALPRPGFE